MSGEASTRSDDVLRAVRGRFWAGPARQRLGLAGRMAAVIIGFLIAGPMGALVAILALVAIDVEPTGAVPRAAAVALALAAITTVVEEWPGSDFDLRFATDRPLAGALAQSAAVLAVVSVLVGIRRERASVPARTAGAPRRRLTSEQLGSVWTSAAVGVVAGVALLTRAVGTPSALPFDYGPALTALRSGRWMQTASHPPLASVVAALGPVPGRWSAMVATLVTAGVVTALGFRLGGRRVGLACAVLAAVLPSIWGQQLPESLAALGVVGGVAWAWPDRLDARRGALAGCALGLAALARPEAVLAVPVVIAWVVVRAGTWRLRAGTVTATAVLVLVALTTVLPWSIWVRDEFGTRLPSTNLGRTLAGATAPGSQHGALLGSWDPKAVFEAGAEHEGASDRAYRRLARENLEPGRIPVLVAARVLRGWELWSPGNARAARENRGLPFPGGLPGAVAEAVVSVAALVALVRLRHQWRRLFPLYALLGLFTLESALLFGDRGLRGWVAPLVALTAALLLADVGRWSSARSSPAS